MAENYFFVEDVQRAAFLGVKNFEPVAVEKNGKIVFAVVSTPKSREFLGIYDHNPQVGVVDLRKQIVQLSRQVDALRKYPATKG